MLTDSLVAIHRADALRVCKRLNRLISRLPPGGPALPGELTVALSREDVRHGAAMFVCMAAEAVARKYQAARRLDVATELAWFGSRAAESCSEVNGLAIDDELRRRRSRWIVATKRLGPHATRSSYGERDLYAALASWKAFGHYATPWVCQQPDWRFRWTTEGRHRLGFLVDCWDAYSRCGFSPEDRLIGLSDMPISPLLRAQPCP